MRITVAKSGGYCFGVRDAVNMAYDAAEKYGEVYMLGSIVHNEKVVEDLSSAGAKIVKKASNKGQLEPVTNLQLKCSLTNQLELFYFLRDSLLYLILFYQFLLLDKFQD